MHIHNVAIALLLTPIVPAFGQLDETKEPALRHTLVVNGKSFPIELGENIRIPGRHENLKVRLPCRKDAAIRVCRTGLRLPGPIYVEREGERS